MAADSAGRVRVRVARAFIIGQAVAVLAAFKEGVDGVDLKGKGVDNSDPKVAISG